MLYKQKSTGQVSASKSQCVRLPVLLLVGFVSWFPPRTVHCGPRPAPRGAAGSTASSLSVGVTQSHSSACSPGMRSARLSPRGKGWRERSPELPRWVARLSLGCCAARALALPSPERPPSWGQVPLAP